MTDRELLELAAKAAGYVVQILEIDGSVVGRWLPGHTQNGMRIFWQPLREDGDALRLAVKLQIAICHNHAADHQKWVLAERAGCESAFPPACCVEDDFEEPQRMEATRRAIVRAAAEIGKAMQ